MSRFPLSDHQLSPDYFTNQLLAKLRGRLGEIRLPDHWKIEVRSMLEPTRLGVHFYIRFHIGPAYRLIGPIREFVPPFKVEARMIVSQFEIESGRTFSFVLASLWLKWLELEPRIQDRDPRIGLQPFDPFPMSPMFGDPPHRLRWTPQEILAEPCSLCDRALVKPIWGGPNLGWVHRDCWVSRG